MRNIYLAYSLTIFALLSCSEDKLDPADKTTSPEVRAAALAAELEYFKSEKNTKTNSLGGKTMVISKAEDLIASGYGGADLYPKEFEKDDENKDDLSKPKKDAKNKVVYTSRTNTFKIKQSPVPYSKGKIDRDKAGEIIQDPWELDFTTQSGRCMFSTPVFDIGGKDGFIHTEFAFTMKLQGGVLKTNDETAEITFENVEYTNKDQVFGLLTVNSNEIDPDNELDVEGELEKQIKNTGLFSVHIVDQFGKVATGGVDKFKTWYFSAAEPSVNVTTESVDTESNKKNEKEKSYFLDFSTADKVFVAVNNVPVKANKRVRLRVCNVKYHSDFAISDVSVNSTSEVVTDLSKVRVSASATDANTVYFRNRLNKNK